MSRRLPAFADSAIVLIALSWLAYIVVATRTADWIASDDAFISFQYARTLARGHGLVFNVGERVWGFTSPLQTLLLGALTACGSDTIHAAFVSAFLWIALSATLLYRLASEFLPRALGAVLAIAFLLDRTQHGPYDLESNLLVVTQLAFLLAATREQGILANVLGALACLVRPDSLLLVVPVLLMGRETRRPRALLWFIAIGLLWEGFALAYYGELIPNSYHAKSGLTAFRPFLENCLKSISGVTIADRLGFAAEPSWTQRAVVLVLSLVPLLDRDLRRRRAILYALVLYPFLLVVAYSYIGSYRGHNWEFYSARFFLRVSAAVGLLILGRAIATRLQLPLPARRLIAISLLVFVLANGTLQTLAMVRSLTHRDTSYWRGARNATYRNIANWANANLPRGSTVAISEVGTFAYYTDLQVIDVSGIVTRGYRPEERMNHSLFMRRYAPAYAIVYGDQSNMILSPTLRYERLQFFPAQGFAALSVLAKE